MKPRTLLILLVLVLGLGAFIWLYERKLPSSEERETLGKKVFALEKGDVTAVAIDAPKGSVRLERAPAPKPVKDKKDQKEGTDEPAADWRLTKPLAARADAFAVDRLLDAVTSLSKTRTLDEVDPKAVGLDKPRATVRLTTKDGEKVLRIGAEVPPGGSTIAGVEGQKGAYVVSDAVLSEVDKAPGEWRDHQVFRGNREAVQRITLTGGAGGAGGVGGAGGAGAATRGLLDGAPRGRPGRPRSGGRSALGPDRPHRRPLPGRSAESRGPGAQSAERRGGRGLLGRHAAGARGAGELGDRSGGARGAAGRRAGLWQGGGHGLRAPHPS